MRGQSGRRLRGGRSWAWAQHAGNSPSVHGVGSGHTEATPPYNNREKARARFRRTPKLETARAGEETRPTARDTSQLWVLFGRSRGRRRPHRRGGVSWFTRCLSWEDQTAGVTLATHSGRIKADKRAVKMVHAREESDPAPEALGHGRSLIAERDTSVRPAIPKRHEQRPL